MTPTRRTALFALAGMTLLGAAGFALGSRSPPPQERSIHVVAHRYGYDPPVIRVNRGDLVRLTFGSTDVEHGFYLEGYGLDVTILPLRSTVEVTQAGVKSTASEVVFRADREGKFRYRCSHTCGFMHPFMLGELLVGPNRLLPTSLGMMAGLVLAGLLGWRRRS